MTTNPFHIFPKGIWEIILTHAGNTEDIENALKAAPQLRTLSKGKDFTWRIYEIFPLLYPEYLTFTDLMTCRLVSSRWRTSVTSWLDTNLDPFKSSLTQSQVPETQLSHYRLLAVTRNFRQFQGVYLGRRNARFYSRTGCDALPENSFPSFHSGNIVDLWETSVMLQIFGSGLSSVDITFPSMYCRDPGLLIEDVMQPLFRCLSWLPNLKSLRLIFGCFPPRPSKEQNQLLPDFIAGATFPFRLEEINVEFEDWYENYFLDDNLKHVYGHLLVALANHNNVQRLTVYPRSWTKRLGSHFPNLSKLSAYATDLGSLMNVLRSFQHPKDLSLDIAIKDIAAADLINALTPLGTSSLEISIFGERGTRINPVCNFLKLMVNPAMLFAVSPIRTLTLRLSSRVQDFSFLRLLPNIRNLQIDMELPRIPEICHFYPMVLRSADPVQMPLGIYFYDGRRSVQKFNFVWEMLPQLKILIINGVKYCRNCGTREYIQHCESDDEMH